MELFIGNKRVSSWSLRPWIVMKHFEIPFREHVIVLDQPNTAREIAAVSPSGRVPTLVDRGAHLWESLAICEYLAETFPDKRLWPSSRTDRAFARSIANEMHSGFAALRSNCPMQVHKDFSDFRPSEKALLDLARIEQIWRLALERSGGPYLMGAFTIADAMYAPIMFRVRTYHLKLGSTARDYYETMLQHPAMGEWMGQAMLEKSH